MKQLIEINQLTWAKSGWFYLWLMMFFALWIVSKNQFFEPLEAYNFQLLSQVGISYEHTYLEKIYQQKPLLDEKTALQFNNLDYLFKSFFGLLIEIGFCLLAMGLLASLTNQSRLVKTASILIYVLLTIAVQILLLNLMIWFSIILVNLVLLFSITINILYLKELELFKNQNIKINQLIEYSALNRYQERTFEPMIPIIEECLEPTEQLIIKIQEVAILAEGDKNNQLAKRLHRWIISHQADNRISIERMHHFAQIEQQNTLTDTLDSTLIIDGSQKAEVLRSELLNIKHFGRYETEGILGKGAMGIVYQGVDPKINRHVAIKTLFLHDSFSQPESTSLEQQSAVERFFREAETAGNLSHANIVTIYDVGEQEVDSATGAQTLGYIAMDLLEGQALNEFVKKDSLLPPFLVFQLMIQMADALEYAHCNSVVHRDIKPANIIYNDVLKKATLTDFGIAYMADHSKTKTGTIMGSPYYMSPEQVIGSKVDGRSDIFSLGVTFYQLLTGELPFNGESIASVAFHITNTKHQSVRNHINKLPTSAARVTNKALQKNESKRYQSMKEFKQALVNALKKDFKKQPL